MTDPETDKNSQPRRLRDLEARLQAARRERQAVMDERKGTGHLSASALGIGWRLIAEMASAIFVGGLIGWYLDRWLGSSPGFLLGFLMLGIFTGLWNVWRTVQRLNASGVLAGLSEDEDSDDSKPGSSGENK